MNHLEGEKSRYLKQHADNPVDWYPWCDGAFEKAKNEDKPIFLSIGYSSCHWCHVMAHESFEDESVAELMNKTFVSIKVDKEERPDVDKVFMKIARAMSGRGGWPLNIIMTPDKKPFFAGTYIPKESKSNRLGLKDLTKRIKNLWENDRNKLLSTGDKVISSLKEKRLQPSKGIDDTTLDKSYNTLKKSFDRKYSGFGDAPKFPSPHNLIFLIRYYERTEKSKSLEMVKETLDTMRLGGIYDHIGYGFHRYSTDRQWKLPHFEKMLYDQAMMVIAYSKTYRATKEKRYKKTAEETIEYVLRELKAESGSFYSSQDADVGGVEGAYYTWSEEEIDDLLEDDAEKFKEIYNIESEGNYREESTGEKTNKNVVYRDEDIKHLAERYDQDEKELINELEGMREVLFEKRSEREIPGKDKKILTDWNGMFITALAKAGRIFDDDEILTEAKNNMDFILQKMSYNNHLYHRYIEGDVGIDGMLDDYAYLIWALIELYRSTKENRYIQKAMNYTETIIDQFWDEDNGGFYFSSNDELPLKEKEVYDGAYPSGNSIALFDLVYLSKELGKEDLKEKAKKMIQTFSSQIKSSPSQYTMFLNSFEYYIAEKENQIIK
ncbi:MAG: thioredoxin domain-containing protein [Thermoplasmatota archaeon]